MRELRSVWKFELAMRDGSQRLFLPLGTQILSVQEQNGSLVLWGLVNPEDTKTSPLLERVFMLVMTGQPFSEPEVAHVGTVQLKESGLVVHVFEVFR